ncbi:MAG TPA: hypothetical protein VKI00_29255 [Mycobacterium sp.]|uniref:hypothetical protein n=1 Tax=Mycobacterium sp. TaxID=1785 RepID=UPI002CF72C92|nr:hypothetical protein [Mycobacterium sp.]HME79603.1 hypothetical protein [Mycobacterium sp.]
MKAGTSAATRIGVVAVVVLVAACARHGPPAPPTPSGTTIIGGLPMAPAPPPPPGWKVQPVVPTSQQQAQDTVLGYLKKTLQALPAGTVFDRSRYAGSGNTPCNDEPTGVPPNEFSDIRDAVLPPDTDLDAMIAKAGEIWQGWGWYVRERDGFGKPNRFGYAPDGYSLQIVSAEHNGYPPTITGVSPCFPGELVRDDIKVPVVLKADS